MHLLHLESKHTDHHFDNDNEEEHDEDVHLRDDDTVEGGQDCDGYSLELESRTFESLFQRRPRKAP